MIFRRIHIIPLFKTIAFVLVMLISNYAYSQTQNVIFNKIGMEQGLSFNMITGILQDRQGYIWVSTWNGLNRYDGYNFKIYKHIDGDSTSLRVNKISSLLEDKSGRLWVGTFGGGLSLFNREEENFANFIHNPKDNKSIITDKILSIYEDSKSRIWVGTYKVGVSLIENSKNITQNNSNAIEFTNIKSDYNNPYSLKGKGILSFVEDNKGIIWLGSYDGWLNKLILDKNATEQFTIYSYYPDSKIIRSTHDLSSQKLLADEKHNEIIWIVDYYNGLYWFDSEREKFISKDPFNFFDNKLPIEKISSIQVDDGEYIIAGSEMDIYNIKLDKLGNFPNEINHYNLNPIKKYNTQNLSVEHILKDSSGIIWIGTESRGLYTLKSTEQFNSYVLPVKNEFSSEVHVLSVLEDNSGNLWIGTTDGLFKYKNNSYEKYLHNSNIPGTISSNTIYNILQDHKGVVWIGTSRGLDKFNKSSNDFTSYMHDPKDSTSISNGEIIKLFEDSKGTLWIGSWNGGLNKLTRSGKVKKEGFLHYKFDETDPHSVSNNRIMSLAEDKYGVLWIGTADGGLNKLVSDYINNQDGSISKPVFRNFVNNPTELNSLSNNDVRSIYIDKRGIFWLGTFGGGLNKFIPPTNDDKPARFYHYNKNDGLANDIVRSILPDSSGHLWIGTANGLSKFDVKNEIFWNYNIKDGLQTDKFEDVAFKNNNTGTLYFGGVGGLVSFNPRKLLTNTYIPRAVITSIKHYNVSDGKMVEEKGMSEKKKIFLSYQDNIINFEFSLLNYNNTAKNKYAYKLEGHNNNWIQLGTKRDVTFTNLSPGEYKLYVKGSNSDGIWNNNASSIQLIILPPWWQTWWAYLFYAFLLFMILYFIRRYELGRINLKNQLTIEKVETTSLRKLDKIKTRFFTNISHEFRTPLTLILGQIENVQSANLDVSLKQKLHVAHKNAQRILRLINQLLDLSKIDAGEYELKAKPYNIVAFLKNIFFSFESLAQKKNIELKLICPTDNILVNMEVDKLEKVFFNVISNAFKFSNTGGRIIIEISTVQDLNNNNQCTEEENQIVTISVKDSGVGIKENILPLIFDRFYQVDSSKTRNYSGTGIGLAIAKELVELHKGTITVNSEEGVGTEFLITLPLSEKQDQEISQQIIQSNKELVNFTEEIIDKDSLIGLSNVHNNPENITKINSQIILLVEDNFDVRSYVKDELIGEYQIIEAEDGLVGMNKAETNIPDLIITDVMMPKLDGYQFCKEIRKNEKTSHIPIIMLTAKASFDDKIEGLETGIDAYLTKPFNAKELHVRISKLLHQRELLRKKYGNITQLKPSEIIVESIDEIFIKKILDVIDLNIEEEFFGVENLASKVNMSVSQLNRKLGALLNQSAGKLIRSMRLQRAADLLRQNSGTIAEICYQVGFSDQANFTRAFKKQFGESPSIYKKNN